MNDRSTALLLIAVTLAGHGVYIAGERIAMGRENMAISFMEWGETAFPLEQRISQCRRAIFSKRHPGHVRHEEP